MFYFLITQKAVGFSNRVGEKLIKQTPDEMIELSVKYDIHSYAEYADDKTVIKICFS